MPRILAAGSLRASNAEPTQYRLAGQSTKGLPVMTQRRSEYTRRTAGINTSIAAPSATPNLARPKGVSNPAPRRGKLNSAVAGDVVNAAIPRAMSVVAFSSSLVVNRTIPAF